MAEQLSFFEDFGKAELTEQDENLQRVSGKIANLVRAYWSTLSEGQEFTAAKLTQFVMRYEPDIAPDSPRRIMSDLASHGQLQYEVVNRRRSLYRKVR